MKCDYCDREATFVFATGDSREDVCEVHKKMPKEKRKKLKSKHSA